MAALDLASAFAGARVLLTGGLGFIGSNLAIRLVGLGSEVLLVDSLLPNYGGNPFNIAPIRERARIEKIDVRDTARLKPLIEGCDYLFNLAGQTSHLDSMLDPVTDLEINCVAQLRLLESCRAVNPRCVIVFASTRQIYGRAIYLPVDEKHLLHPIDVNGINKMAGEAYHILYQEVYDIPTTALRLTNTYGPRMRVKDERKTFVGVWLRRLVENEPFEVWGGAQMRCPHPKQATRLVSTHPTTLQEENRIRRTREMSCRSKYSIAGLCPPWSGPCRRAAAAVQIRVLADLWGLAGHAAGSPSDSYW